jgi:hypothetical protein
LAGDGQQEGGGYEEEFFHSSKDREIVSFREPTKNHAMGIFDLFSKKQSAKSDRPYRNEGLNKIYDLLFCDNIDLYTPQDVYPWDVLFTRPADIERLQAVANDRNLETRARVLAFHLLRTAKISVPAKELFGVIIEVSLRGGLDVLAAFSDGTARYINHAEKVLVWETRTEESQALIGDLFNQSVNVVNRLGPWDLERRPFPGREMIRLSFLVSDGLYFGEGPFADMERDPMGGPVVQAATRLMAFLTSQKNDNN